MSKQAGWLIGGAFTILIALTGGGVLLLHGSSDNHAGLQRRAADARGPASRARRVTSTTRTTSGIAAADITDARRWSLDCSTIPLADKDYRRGRVVVDAIINVTAHGGPSDQWIAAASCDGYGDDEVEYIKTKGLQGPVTYTQVIRYPSNMDSDHITGLREINANTVVATGTSTPASGHASRFSETYEFGAAGWDISTHHANSANATHAHDNGGTVASTNGIVGRSGDSDITAVGYGALKLGMSIAQIRRTGLVTGEYTGRGNTLRPVDWNSLTSPSLSDCSGLGIAGQPGAVLEISPSDGLADDIMFNRAMKTSRGIGDGSPTHAVLNAYPHIKRTPGVWIARVVPGVAYYFDIQNHRVMQIDLSRLAGACWN